MADTDHDALMIEIARGLVVEGRYLIYPQAGRLQDLVDLRWAARRAGQLLDCEVLTTVTRSDDFDGKLAVIVETVPDGRPDPEPDEPTSAGQSVARRPLASPRRATDQVDPVS